jgi:hypothetical protein
MSALSASGKPIKIAFYGGMANNCYLVCSRMRELGFDAITIRDRLDTYAISQPMWEDHPFTLSYAELAASSGWTAERWDELARDKGWVAPQWLVDPVQCSDEADLDYAAVADDPDLVGYFPAPADHHRKIIALMRKQDLVFVSNVHAIILALLSGVRFVICPAGGEFMVASGLMTAEGDVGRTLDRQRRLLMVAFHRASAVLTNTAFFQHKTLTGGIWPLIRDYHRVRFERVSLPFLCTAPLAHADKRQRLNAFLATLGQPPVTSPVSVFVPSRIDYTWKAQDRIIEALRSARFPKDFTFMFAGWGADYADFQERTRGMAGIRILGAAFSKPVLYDIYRSVDCVVDQFTLGHIGSAAREACAVGTPVMAWIDGVYRPWPFRPELPVLNARTSEDIAAVLDAIALGRIDLAAAGKRAQSWVAKYSGPMQMGRALGRHATLKYKDPTTQAPTTQARDMRSVSSETQTP